MGSLTWYCCLPHSQIEVLGPGLRATNLTPTLTSPFRSTLRSLQSVVQVCITANKGLSRCNAGQTAQRTHWNCHKRTPAMHWHPAARFTQSCTLERPIARKNRHNRVDTQLGSCLGSCPRWHTPIARSLDHWGRALVADSLGTMLQHRTGRPASSWARCCPRLRHFNDGNGKLPVHTLLGLSHPLPPGCVMSWVTPM